MNKQKDKSKKKKNVQVAVRIRPLNDTERNENGKYVVKSDNITSIVTVNNSKQFGPFDKCYGPETTQQELYMDVVSPLIQEVLSGYNCTVFAYGQTGTGKTFTMEGRHDDDVDHTWESDPKAGIIPRALHHIFSELTEVEDFCVRVSYVELYNEELYDLLGSNSDTDQRLRIFDDKAHGGNGVLINNLTEVTVRNRNEVYALLKKGAEKRRTAATLMNMNSSRSHSVFTVSVMFRDSNTKNEELLLKTGKLNLVDLAGSENIGRSGSTHGRAREAGSINQSLLTLGRVITALTTNAAHIPYRESKLTRILQDSLGGKTITTIIATLTPSSTSIEESVSTLEYAQRAKNIKNSPEVNQQVTRAALLREYSEEIEKLRRDLVAAREKNGVFLAQENYDELQNQIKDNNTKIEELEAQLQATMNKYNQIIDDFEYLDQQYQIAYEKHLHALRKLEMRWTELKEEKAERAKATKSFEAARVALEKSEDESRRLFAQARQVNESNIVLGNELEKMHEKHAKCRRIFEDNNKLLGNFSANQISSAHKIKDEVITIDSSCKQETELIREQCITVRNATITKFEGVKEVLTNIDALLKQMNTNVSETLTVYGTDTESSLKKYTATLQSFLNDVRGLFNQLETIESEKITIFNDFLSMCSQFITQYNEQKNKLKTSSETSKTNNTAIISQFKSLLNQLETDSEATYLHNESCFNQIESIESHFTTQTSESNEAVNTKSDQTSSLCQKGEGLISQCHEVSSNFNTTHSDMSQRTITVVKEQTSKVTKEVSDTIGETTNTIVEACSLVNNGVEVIQKNLADHETTNRGLIEKVVNHFESSQRSMEKFIHQELLHYKSEGDTPAKKKRKFGVELFEPTRANELFNNAASAQSPVRPSDSRESLLASDAGMLLSPSTLKENLLCKRKLQEDVENMNID